MSFRQPLAFRNEHDQIGLMTDLYELTMMAGYLRSGLADKNASFEVFFRRLPQDRSYLIFAGLEQAIAGILEIRFTPEQIAWLGSLPAFAGVDRAVLDALGRTRFQGDVWSVPEGTLVFPGETLMRITARLPEAQWLETFLLSTLASQTLIASKGARMATAAQGRQLFEFGARRGQGPQAGLLVARAAYLAGFAGTSLVEAARQLGIPAVGTMAHSWVQAFDTEQEAFQAYATTFPGQTTLLVDTYEVESAVRRAAAIEPPIAAVRIDSGDLDALSRKARSILDECGRRDVKIIVSGDLTERSIAQLAAANAPIDGFGVGAELVAPRDAPTLSMVYKLVQLEDRGAYKLSPGKRTYPMAKQVFRNRDPHGWFSGDRVARHDENQPGEPLLVPVIRGGELVRELPSLEEIRQRVCEQLASLPPQLRSLDAAAVYPVTYSDRLEEDGRRLMMR